MTLGETSPFEEVRAFPSELIEHVIERNAISGRSFHSMSPFWRTELSLSENLAQSIQGEKMQAEVCPGPKCGLWSSWVGS